MREEILKAIEEQVRKPDIKEDDTVQGLGLDRLDHVELIMFLEERFELEIMDEESDAWKTIRDMVDYVEKHKGV